MPLHEPSLLPVRPADGTLLPGHRLSWEWLAASVGILNTATRRWPAPLNPFVDDVRPSHFPASG
jgi:hypothetical protein